MGPASDRLYPYDGGVDTKDSFHVRILWSMGSFVILLLRHQLFRGLPVWRSYDRRWKLCGRGVMCLCVLIR